MTELHFNNPPIAEAMIDLVVHLPNGKSAVDLGSAFGSESERYPSRELIQGLENLIDPVHNNVVINQSAHLGFRATSSDGRFVVQFRKNGFTLSHLRPYSSWETFVREARRLWSCYRVVNDSFPIKRIAVRYINRIEIPVQVGLSEYFNIRPEVPEFKYKAADRFFINILMPQPDIGANLIVNQLIDDRDPDKPELVPVILDIDLFTTESITQDNEGVWENFEVLRDRKNSFFQACITDKTRELFK